MSEQPEALRLADVLTSAINPWPFNLAVAAELRRLYTLNQELLDVLEEMEKQFNPETPQAIKVWDKVRYAIVKAEGTV